MGFGVDNVKEVVKLCVCVFFLVLILLILLIFLAVFLIRVTSVVHSK